MRGVEAEVEAVDEEAVDVWCVGCFGEVCLGVVREWPPCGGRRGGAPIRRVFDAVVVVVVVVVLEVDVGEQTKHWFR